MSLTTQDKNEIREIVNEGIAELVLPRFDEIEKQKADKTDVNVLKTDMNLLKTDVSSLKKDMNFLMAGNDKIIGMLQDSKAEQVSQKARLDRHENWIEGASKKINLKF